MQGTPSPGYICLWELESLCGGVVGMEWEWDWETMNVYEHVRTFMNRLIDAVMEPSNS